MTSVPVAKIHVMKTPSAPTLSEDTCVPASQATWATAPSAEVTSCPGTSPQTLCFSPCVPPLPVDLLLRPGASTGWPFSITWLPQWDSRRRFRGDEAGQSITGRVGPLWSLRRLVRELAASTRQRSVTVRAPCCTVNITGVHHHSCSFPFYLIINRHVYTGATGGEETENTLYIFSFPARSSAN
ncbi:hypothetical protein PAMP_000186 [Pampus punctatissimus]